MTMSSGRRVRSTLVAVAIATGLSGLALAPAQAAPVAGARLKTATIPSGWSVASSAAHDRLGWQAPVRGLGDARVQFFSGVRLLGTPRPGPDGSYRLDLPAGTIGDPAQLQARAGGRRVDAAGLKAASQPLEQATPSAAAALPPSSVDPGTPGRYRTVTGEYALRAVKLPDFRRGVEMRAVVVAPKGARGKRPLALFLHGRHSICYGGGDEQDWPCPAGTKPIPSYRGYLRAQNLLASQGYVTVSISANGINGQDFDSPDGGAAARSSLIRTHLADWAAWAGAGRSKAPAIVKQSPVPDLNKVLLMGHSRGGEGVNRAAIDSLLPPPAATDGYHGKVLWKIRGTLQLAPTNFGHDPAADVPSVVVLPGCDGDVYDLQGQITVDGTRGVSTGTALHSAAFVVGANHNFFNSEWTPGLSKAPSWDDWFDPQDKVCGAKARSTKRLTPVQQQQVGATYIAAAARLFVAGDQKVLPLLDGSGERAASVGKARVLSHAVGANRRPLVVPAADTTVAGAGSTKIRLCKEVSLTSAACTRNPNLVVPSFVQLYPVSEDPDRYATDLSWTATGGAGASLKPKVPVSLAGSTALAARVIVPPNSAARQFDVQIADAAGKRATLGRFSLTGLPGTASTVSSWAQEVRVPLARARDLGLDLQQVAELRVIPRSSRGQAYLLDAWGWRAGAPAVTVGAKVRVDIGTLPPVVETDSDVTYQMPVTVSGTGSGRLRLFTASFANPEVGGQLVTVKAGDQFSVPLTVHGDNSYSYGDLLAVLARADRGTQVGDYLGDLQVTEDDPAPTVTVTPLADTVPEGGTLSWQLDLSAAAVVDLYLPIQPVVPAAGRELSTTDVTKAWVEDELYVPQLPSRALSTTEGILTLVVPAGTTRAQVAVPTVTDTLVEPDEHISLEVGSASFDPVPNPPRLLGTVTNKP